VNIGEQERATYDSMWAVPAYHDQSPGEIYLPMFLDMAKPTMRGSILDAGCGAGKGALALKREGFQVSLCDLSNAGLSPELEGMEFVQAPLWSNLKRQVGFRDYVYCCDVMEHIPPTFTMLVASRLLEVARRSVFFSISLMPDAFGAWVGKPLHQTVQSFVQWRDQLDEVGRVKEARDLLHCGVYLVEPKHVERS